MNTTYESKEDLTYEVKVICVNARRIYFVQKSNHHDVIYACNNCEFLVVGHFNGEFWTVVESNLTHTCPEPYKAPPPCAKCYSSGNWTRIGWLGLSTLYHLSKLEAYILLQRTDTNTNLINNVVLLLFYVRTVQLLYNA